VNGSVGGVVIGGGGWLGEQPYRRGRGRVRGCWPGKWERE